MHPKARAALDAARRSPPSAEHRRKLSEAHQRRGTRPPNAGPPWTAPEDALLGTMPDLEVARRTGRSIGAARSRRAVLRIPAVSRRGPRMRPPLAKLKA